MKLSARMEYATLALMELALQYGGGQPVQHRSIAEKHKISERFLARILIQLKEAGFLTSVRGVTGGYRLAIPPEDITLGLIASITDERTEPDERAAEMDSSFRKTLYRAWNAAENQRQAYLNSITLRELIQRSKM